MRASKPQPDLAWLDKIIAEQKSIQAVAYGSSTIVSNAAIAYDYFSEDALEAHADSVRSEISAEGLH